MKDIKRAMRKYAVEAGNVKEFLERYSRPSATARGPEYIADRIKWHEEQLALHGYTMLSRHDSATGDVVAYFPKEG